MKTKKLISILLVVVMLVSMIPIINVSAEQDNELWTAENEDGSPKYADLSWFTAGGGTTSDTAPSTDAAKYVNVAGKYYRVETNGAGKTFTITSGAQLAGVAFLANLMEAAGQNAFQSSTFKITADADLSAHLWVPICGVKEFKASVNGLKADGTCAKIIGMRIDQTTTAAALTAKQQTTAFIGQYASGRLENLEITNSSIVSDGGYTAAFVAKEVGATVYNNLSVTSTEIKMAEQTNKINDSSIGGILAFANSGNNWEDKFTNCVFAGSIVASVQNTNVGGILGRCYGSPTLSGCIVTGSIVSEVKLSEQFIYGGTGGLVGYCYGDDNTPIKPTVEKCYVSANITAYKNVGGLFGVLETNGRDGANVAVNVTDTQFDGTIYASTTDCIGALVGRVFPCKSGTTPTFNFTRVLSTGIATLINGSSIKYVLVHNTNAGDNAGARFVFNDCYALFALDLLNDKSQVKQFIGGVEVTEDANTARIIPENYDPNVEKSVWTRVEGRATPVLAIAKDYIGENSAATNVTAPTTSWTDDGNFDLSWIEGTDTAPEGVTSVKVGEKYYQTTGYTAGTEFIISDASDLAGLSKLLVGAAGQAFANCTFKVTKNLDLSAHKWTPIGHQTDGASVFYGSMVGATGSDGTGSAVITGMYIDSTVSGTNNGYECATGMFAYFRGPRLANLELKSTTVKAVNGYVGSFVGMIDISSAVELVNLKSDATMVYTPATKKSWSCAGGIVGHIINSVGVTFDKCVFTGDITSTNGQAGAVGGILGIVQGKVAVNNSIVTADITLSTTAIGDGSDWCGYGGIIGAARWNTGIATTDINSCYVSSTITGYQRVAGIVGNLYYNGDTAYPHNASIKNTQFDGAVKIASSNEEGGGAIATKRLSGGTGVTLVLENVLNTGTITDTNGNSRTVSKGCAYDHGSIWVAKDWTNTTIKDCYGTEAVIIAHQGSETLATLIPQLLGYNTWIVRDSYPVLAIAKDIASTKYTDVDLSWFKPSVNGTLENATTQKQVGGLIRLIEACGSNAVKFTNNYAALLKLPKAYEGLLSDFAIDDTVETAFKACVYESELDKISHIYAQSSKLPSEGTSKYNVRFVAEIESLRYAEAGFDFYISYKDENGKTVYTNLDSTKGITTAYTSVIANDVVAKPDGTGWFVVFTTNIDVSIGTDIKITAVANVSDGKLQRYGEIGNWNISNEGTLTKAAD